MRRTRCLPRLPADWPDVRSLTEAGEVAALYAIEGVEHLTAAEEAAGRGAYALRKGDRGAASIAAQRAAAEASMAVLVAIQAETWLAGQQHPSSLAREGAWRTRQHASVATGAACRIREALTKASSQSR